MSDEEITEDEADLQNDRWLQDNFLDLMQNYPREWIAVLNGIIIARAGTKAGVQNIADEVANGEEYSIYFIPPTGTFTDVQYERR
ncbi:MAG: hypothetical protein A4E32_00516 [Methanomassiliicoccales archaeon PtaU1.Bin124]|nr:MAG: hypothetical protein A4E32_00516 [Methanomassiliicoccales archaeon PtaU1.Bin124]